MDAPSDKSYPLRAVASQDYHPPLTNPFGHRTTKRHDRLDRLKAAMAYDVRRSVEP